MSGRIQFFSMTATNCQQKGSIYPKNTPTLGIQVLFFDYSVFSRRFYVFGVDVAFIMIPALPVITSRSHAYYIPDSLDALALTYAALCDRLRQLSAQEMNKWGGRFQ
jgi:hypothetical protein